MSFAVHALSKSYGGQPVLKCVDLTVSDGEIHALLGANGAGKSTLIKCISGATKPDGGRIVIGEETYYSLTPKSSRQAGVAVVYQDFSLAPSLTVTENVFLGRELRRGPFISRRRQRDVVTAHLGQFGVDGIDPDMPVELVSGASLQLVEIAKAIQSDPKILVLDEPTSALTAAEASKLSEQLRNLKRHNLPILYVTHRLSEVFELADRVTVLRGGQVVLTEPTADVSSRDLVTSIAGAMPAHEAGDASREAPTLEPILRISGMVANGIGPLDLELFPGDILGVFGLRGSGRTELLEAIFGVRRIIAGTVSLNGKDVHFRGPPEAVQAGIALVPSDRLRKSIFSTLSGGENVLLPSYRRLATNLIRNRRKEQRGFREAAGNLNLAPLRDDLEARRFSGGNQQKLVLARWLHRTASECKVLLLDEPTQGVDVGGRGDLYAALTRAATRKVGVVVTSSEADELELLCNRVLVLNEGRPVKELRGGEVNAHNLLVAAHLGE
jgi:ribose transport system ATP-binding protein